MLNAGVSRDRLAALLGAAFAEGLLSDQTLSYRLGVVFGQRLVDPASIVGDLAVRGRRQRSRWRPRLAAIATWLRLAVRPEPTDVEWLVLALDWASGEDDLVIGRGSGCDVPLISDTVSRRHARLIYRDGAWIIEDLASTNGIVINGVRVGRYQLRPGDHVQLGDQRLKID